MFSRSRSLEEHSGDLCWDLCCLNTLFSGMKKVMEGAVTKLICLWVNKVCYTLSQTHFLPRVENESMGSRLTIMQRRKTLTLQQMSDNVSTGLVAFSKANQSSFIRNREQSKPVVLLCASIACLHAFDILPAPLEQGQSSLGLFWRTAGWSGSAAVPGLAGKSQAHQPRKGHVRDKSC